MGTEESLLSVSEDSLCNIGQVDDACSASVSSDGMNAQSSVHSHDTWGSESTEQNDNISSSESVGSVLSRHDSTTGGEVTRTPEPEAGAWSKTLEEAQDQGPDFETRSSRKSSRGTYTNPAMIDMQILSGKEFEPPEQDGHGKAKSRSSSVKATKAHGLSESAVKDSCQSPQRQGGLLLHSVTSVLQDKLVRLQIIPVCLFVWKAYNWIVLRILSGALWICFTSMYLPFFSLPRLSMKDSISNALRSWRQKTDRSKNR